MEPAFCVAVTSSLSAAKPQSEHVAPTAYAFRTFGVSFPTQTASVQPAGVGRAGLRSRPRRDGDSDGRTRYRGIRPLPHAGASALSEMGTPWHPGGTREAADRVSHIHISLPGNAHVPRFAGSPPKAGRSKGERPDKKRTRTTDVENADGDDSQYGKAGLFYCVRLCVLDDASCQMCD